MADHSRFRSLSLTGSDLPDPFSLPNLVHTGRFRLSTFVIKSLFEQFQRVPNLWFLLVGIVNLVGKDLASVSGWVTIGPLLATLAISLCKDALLDLQRRKFDLELNHKPTLVWSGESFTQQLSHTLQAGHVVLIYPNEYCPADLLFLASGHPKDLAYIDVSAILGETNLQVKSAIKATKSFRSVDLTVMSDHLKRLQGEVYYQEPEASYDSFDGRIKLKGFPTAERLSLSNFIPRGSKVSTTPWLIGLVLYTGPETKQTLNSRPIRLKMTRLERLISKMSLVLILLSLVLALVSSLLNFYAASQQPEHNFFLTLLEFILLFHDIAPISLFATIDLLRIYQLWISSRRGKAVSPQLVNPSISEDLGRVEYIVADKTGTLTEGWTTTKEFILGEESFSPCAQAHIFCKHIKKPVLDASETINDELNSPMEDCGYTKLRGMLREGAQREARLLIEAMAVCNLTLVSEGGGEVVFAKEEKAMIASARDFGYSLVEKTSSHCRIIAHKEEHTYQILGYHLTQSPNASLRMAVLPANSPSALLLLKTSVKSLLSRRSLMHLSPTSEFVVRRKDEELQRKGLKSVLFCCKEVTGQELVDLKTRLELANRALYNKEDKLEKVFDAAEAGCEYIGIVGVQEGVTPNTAETVDKLTAAGVNIWVVSGDDAVYTQIAAINAHILSPDIPLFALNLPKTGQTTSFLRRKLTLGVRRLILKQQAGRRDEVEEGMERVGGIATTTELCRVGGARVTAYLSRSTCFLGMDDGLREIEYRPGEVRPYAVLVPGAVLHTAMKDEECKRLLTCLLFLSTTALFCDLLPPQKAQVVSLIKENFRFRPVTLAIGDGSDDVAMLQTAHIGVGLRREGVSSAANSADVVVTHFHQLESLILVQGRWYLQRYSKTAVLFLYKNLLITLVMFGYVMKTDFQATSMFDRVLYELCILLFTSIPVLCIGMLDKDLQKEVILAEPMLHRMRMTAFGWRCFLQFVLIAIVQTVVLYSTIFPSFSSPISPSGHTEDFILIGQIMFVSVILTVFAQEMLEMRRISLIFVISLTISIVALVIYYVVASFYPESDLFGALMRIFGCVVAAGRIFGASLAAAGVGYSIRRFVDVFMTLTPDRAQALCKNSVEKRLEHIFRYGKDLKQVYRQSASSVETEMEDGFHLNRTTLRFRSSYIERAYRWAYIHSHLTGIRIFYVIISVLLLIWLSYGIITGNETGSTVLRACIIILMLAVLYLTRWKQFRRRYIPFVSIAIFVSLLAKFLTEILFPYDGSLITAIYPLATFTMLNVDFVTVLALNCLNIGLFAVSGARFYAMESGYAGGDSAMFMVSFVVILIGITVTTAFVGYNLIKYDRQEFKLCQQTYSEVQRCSEILQCLLPKFVRSRVKDGARYIAEEKGIVSVLFCDICDFDAIIGRMKPSEITDFLDDLFQKFDELCSLNGVVKIETVGKTYMACAGLQDGEEDLSPHLRDISHARRAIELALAMIRTLETYSLPNGTQIQVKIGINTGPVVAGVVGYHKPQFSLVGDAVNTASRMCSTLSTPNTIQISESVFNSMDDKRGITFLSQFLTNVKGKGNMHTYIVSEVLDLSSVSIGSSCDYIDDLSASSSQSSSMTHSPKRHYLSPGDAEKEVKKHTFSQERNSSFVDSVTQSSISLKETSNQRKFRVEYLESNRKLTLWSLSSSALIRVLILIVRVTEYYFDSNSTSKESLIAYVLLTFNTVSSVALTHKYLTSRVFPYCMLVVYAVDVELILFDVYFGNNYEVNLMVAEVMYCMLQLGHCSGFFFREVVLGCVIGAVEWTIATPWASKPLQHIICLVFLLAFLSINIYAHFAHEQRIRFYTNMAIYSQQEIENTEQLLSYMMPPHVLRMLKDDRDTTDSLSNVTVLFADIVGFTNWSADKSPVEVVGMLSDMFTRFDRLCVENHVYKVHTIGDCYVVMGFAAADTNLRNPGIECLNVMKMAFDMVDVILEVNQAKGSHLNMRIGLHTGSVIGGITGTNIVRYDIYGSDVMFANKMESNGEAGKVNVSDTTRRLVQDCAPESYAFQFNTEIEAKALGVTHKCYFVTELTQRKQAKNPALCPRASILDSLFPPSLSTYYHASETKDLFEEGEMDHVKNRQQPYVLVPFSSA